MLLYRCTREAHSLNTHTRIVCCRAFDPRGKQLDVVVPLTHNKAASKTPAQKRLQALGFLPADVNKALKGDAVATAQLAPLEA